MDVGGAVDRFEITATRAGRKVEITNARGTVEVTEVTRSGEAVRTARFMAARVVAIVEHPADESRQTDPSPGRGGRRPSLPVDDDTPRLL